MRWVTWNDRSLPASPAPGSSSNSSTAEPEFPYVPVADLLATARNTGAVPYNIPAVEMIQSGIFGALAQDAAERVTANHHEGLTA
jgi:hypothetical protein